MKLSEIKKMEDCGCFPTPVHELKNLGRELNCRLFIKRDDLTGLGFSGNKVRKLQYLVRDAKDRGYTTLLTFGGVQTNHGRQTAAVANKYGMKSVVIATVEDGRIPEKLSGNLLLDAILGCDVRFLDTSALKKGSPKLSPDEIKTETLKLRRIAADRVIAEYEEKGEKVYEMPAGGSTPIGCLGYFFAVKEIMDQLEQKNQKIDYLVCPTGSNGTYAGLWLGSRYFGAPFEVIGGCVSPHEEIYIENMVKFINETSQFLELNITAKRKDIHILCTECAGIAYDKPDEETFETIYKMARSEGLFIDPCYTGKGFTAVLKLLKSEKIPKGSSVLFIHTGGLPGLYSQQHLEKFSKDLWEGKEHSMVPLNR